MNQSPRPLALLLVLIAGAALGPGDADAQRSKLWTERPGPELDQSQPLSFGHFRDLAAKLSPAVVNIQVSKSVDGSRSMNPFDFFFRGGHPRMPERQAEGVGTGFIIHRDGLILTNNHVVEGADEVTVTLLDERQFTAKVLGTDPATDVALIDIDAKGLVAAPLGDSDSLDVAEWVMAIGNPFGLTHTVTTGIVSAKGRTQVRPDSRLRYRDFIQTDASINPGNSGGPLINVSGEVVGINSAIFGHQSVGVGFAIPVNIAKELLPSLKRHGRPQRSWIGIGIQEVTAELAKSFGLDAPRGALVNHVVRDGPGAKAGLRTGDVITEFDGKPIAHADDLPWLASTAGIGKRVSAKVLRDGKTKRFALVLTELPSGPPMGERPQPERGSEGPRSSSSGELGLTVAPLPDKVAGDYALPPSAGGVLVTGVDHGSPAQRAGLREGDVIVRLDGRKIGGLRSFVERIKRTRAGGRIRLLVRRQDGASLFLVLRKP